MDVPPHLPPSRLPGVGTTIFTVMSALAQQHGAINLGQGFPDFDPDPGLYDAVDAAMRSGHNQYPPMAGVAALREALAAKIAEAHAWAYDPADEITVTAGATQGLLTAVLALVHPGDEVIVLEPCYDAYVPAITLAGARVIRVPLGAGGQRPDFGRLAAAITPRTRMLIVNTPHNPSGAVWRREEWEALADLLAPTSVLLLSDEVYEHMVYDGRQHISASALPALAERSVVVSSFGKTYHATGWKVGHVAAPRALMSEFRKVHQFNVFTVNTPMQHAFAAMLAQPEHHLGLAAFYQRKRDRLRRGLTTSAFELLPCEGSYFQCVRHPAILERGDAGFCDWLVREVGVAAIPLSAFYQDGKDTGVVRLCFAKQDATLDAALERLHRL